MLSPADPVVFAVQHEVEFKKKRRSKWSALFEELDKIVIGGKSSEITFQDVDQARKAKAQVYARQPDPTTGWRYKIHQADRILYINKVTRKPAKK